MTKKGNAKKDNSSESMHGFLSLEEVSPEEYFGLSKVSVKTPKSLAPFLSTKRKAHAFEESIVPDLASIEDEQLTASVPETPAKKSKRKHKKKKLDKTPSDVAIQQTTALNSMKVPSLSTVDEASPWFPYQLHPRIQHQLVSSSFLAPMPIQARMFDKILNSKGSETEDEDCFRDVMGEAPTGSGKTLAFSLPIIHALLTQYDDEAMSLSSPALASVSKMTEDNSVISALILVPTRELGLQVHEHLYPFVEGTSVRLVTLIGGISIAKQKRLLSKKIDILIATPGRLGSFLAATGTKFSQESIQRPAIVLPPEENSFSLKERLAGLRWLVLDEVDRMIETGHFKELFDIFKFIRESDKKIPHARQTFVFSATLSHSAQATKSAVDTTTDSKKQQSKETITTLLAKVPFKDRKPLHLHIRDVPSDASTPSHRASPQVISKVEEFKLVSQDAEKDIYVYLFLLRHPQGRKLLFVNSIDTIRRLSPLLKNLGFPIFTLHSQMQQRQRLKHLDAFKAAPFTEGSIRSVDTSVGDSSALGPIMLCTDVLGRGIDIDKIDYVLHYQCPRSKEIYVHRAGRSGRGLSTHGCSVLFVTPKEWTDFTKLEATTLTLKDLPAGFLSKTDPLKNILMQRITLARELDQLELTQRKEATDASWSSQVKDAFDIDDGPGSFGKNRKRDYDNDAPSMPSEKQRLKDIRRVKAALETTANSITLEKLPPGLSRKYITKNPEALAQYLSTNI